MMARSAVPHSANSPGSHAANLTPVRPIDLIAREGLKELALQEVLPDVVGWKAHGICALPSAWVPPFFVVSASCFDDQLDSAELESAIRLGLSRAGLDMAASVFVRSSGSEETLSRRGELVSAPCAPSAVLQKILELRQAIRSLGKTPLETVHWIVQLALPLREKGHLSNERRISYEPRDWLVEFEPTGNLPGRTQPIAVRSWRDGIIVSEGKLTCGYSANLLSTLKQVTKWAFNLKLRLHFEWVWDGQALFVVQLDETFTSGGTNPHSVIPLNVESISTGSLKVFRLATDSDFQQYKKLKNANIYRGLGYEMPSFLILDDPNAVKDLLAGNVTSELRDDLRELTRRPLVIRTDGQDLPENRREMLPRSEELRSQEQAEKWLKDEYRRKINDLGLTDKKLCLIAHHFVPAVASAWARAEPGKRIVRIESLWGIPEGLYWYSHDTFEVDTQYVDISSRTLDDARAFSIRKRLRFKGAYIAPAEDGRWIPHETDAEHDWARSITKNAWLNEIAYTTRRVAELEGYAVSVMWFIDVDKRASRHRVLPWFHSKSELEGSPQAAPRRKVSYHQDFVVKTRDDWLRLVGQLKDGVPLSRVIVEPTDTELIRNQKFAEELADLAKTHDFVVELSGGILSHAYYALNRCGCRVECADLFGADEETIEFNKIVRDKIPEYIVQQGERADIIRLEGDALISALKRKLVEESFEALDAEERGELIGELADVQEVIDALSHALQISSTDLQRERTQKRKKRGGFEQGVMLIKTVTPQSIQNIQTEGRGGIEGTPEEPVTITNPSDLPSAPPYRRPDLRQLEQGAEKMLTFEVDANSLGVFDGQLAFDMPNEASGKNSFVMSVELKRIKGRVRGVVRLIVGPSQLDLFLDEAEG